MVEGIIATLQSYVLKVVVGIVILLVGFGLGILAKKIIQKLLKEIELNKTMSKIGITHDLEKWAGVIVSYIIYLFTILLFLEKLLIKSVVLWVILGALIMLFLLTFLVGVKDLLPNLIGWLVIQKQGKIKVGKHIDVKEIYGTIERVGYLETEIKTQTGDILYVPNSLFLKSKFKVKN